jgi:hypothetical protein
LLVIPPSSAWCTSKDIAPLKSHEISAFLQSANKKKGELHKAYTLAEDPTEWIESLKSGVVDHDEDEDELADEVDEEPVEDEGKKRKRGGEKTDTKAKKAKLEKLAKSKKASCRIQRVGRVREP